MTEKIMRQMGQISKKTLWLGAVSTACFFALGSGQALSAPVKPEAASQRQGLWTQVLHKYLFFRIPLWRPDAFLNRAWPWLARTSTSWPRRPT